MKKHFTIENILLLVVVTLAIVFIGPRTLKNLNLKGQNAAYTDDVIDINNNPITLTPPYALVFWATWCKPCEIELKRINSMIKDKKISANKVTAISVDNNVDDVKSTVQKNNYLFPVVWDQTRKISSAYEVQGTPTIVVVGKDDKIKWATSGVSPTLELRLKSYLK